MPEPTVGRPDSRIPVSKSVLKAWLTESRYWVTVHVEGPPGAGLTIYLLSHKRPGVMTQKPPYIGKGQFLARPFPGRVEWNVSKSGWDTGIWGPPKDWYFKISWFPPGTPFEPDGFTDAKRPHEPIRLPFTDFCGVYYVDLPNGRQVFRIDRCTPPPPAPC